MDFKEEHSKTVISTAITLPNNISPTLNKTAHECTKEELISQVFEQLKESFDLPDYTLAIISPEITKNKDKYVSIDTAYISSSNFDYLPFQLSSNLYTVGCQNGHSLYKFTSLENAVSNAVVLSNILGSNKIRNLDKKISLSNFIKILLFIIIISVLIYTWKKN